MSLGGSFTEIHPSGRSTRSAQAVRVLPDPMITSHSCEPGQDHGLRAALSAWLKLAPSPGQMRWSLVPSTQSPLTVDTRTYRSMSSPARRSSNRALTTSRPAAGDASKRITAISWMLLSLKASYLPAVWSCSPGKADAHMSAVAWRRTVSPAGAGDGTTKHRQTSSNPVVVRPVWQFMIPLLHPLPMWRRYDIMLCSVRK